jgi:TrmH family RNA methyltransferase
MSDSLLTLMRDLGRRRGRERRGLALAEGVRLVEEALASGVAIRGAAVAPSLEGTERGRALKAALDGAGVRHVTVTDAELERLADTDHPQGVVAIIEPRRWTLQAIDPGPQRPALVLDGVQDPGNVGTMVRTALALGAAGVVALPGTAELTNPKVIRGAMGALFRLPAVSTSDAELGAWLASAGGELWVAAMEGEPIAAAAALGGTQPPPAALVIGNEGAGVRPELVARAARRVAIPMRGSAESLNAAVAAAILLYEVTRDR